MVFGVFYYQPEKRFTNDFLKKKSITIVINIKRLKSTILINLKVDCSKIEN